VISSLNNDDVFVIAKDAFPFFLLMMLATILITVFPQIVLFLPNLMK
jgi:C4-dicarboxylate transporter, DctM subunit